MNPFFLYIIYVIAIFALKIFVAYFSFKIDKKKKYAFTDLFIWKDELFDSAVVSLIFILMMLFFSHIHFTNAMAVNLRGGLPRQQGDAAMRAGGGLHFGQRGTADEVVGNQPAQLVAPGEPVADLHGKGRFAIEYPRIAQ